jgi:hypothetical protein
MRKPEPIPWPQEKELDPARAGDSDRLTAASAEIENVAQPPYEIALQLPSEEHDHGVHSGIF